MNNSLKYFVGKVCSIFVAENSRDLRAEDPQNYPASYYRYFLGMVESIDEEGLLLTQLHKGLKVFVMKKHLVAIAEEEVLNPDNPQDAEEIRQSIENAKELQKQSEEKPLAFKKSPYFDPEAMKRISEDLNKNFGEAKP
jgi:hypothetical protein